MSEERSKRHKTRKVWLSAKRIDGSYVHCSLVVHDRNLNWLKAWLFVKRCERSNK